MITLASQTRHKCFISYHHDDETEVDAFIRTFDHHRDILISQGIGASMPGNIINSTNDEYIKSQIRANYLNGTTVTIVLVGKETWGRRFVDWEIAASLRNTSTSSANGLVAIKLPSAMRNPYLRIPARLHDNIQSGYAHIWNYPTTTEQLAQHIETAFLDRTRKANSRNNRRQLRLQDAS